MSKYTLTYSKEKSQTIYVEEVLNKDGKGNITNNNLYFKKEYNEALSLIDSIVKQQDQSKINKNVYSSINNRILFMGQRGSGKTSVMVTLSNYLEKAEKVKYEPENENEGENKDGNDSKKEKEIECRFLCLPMVDPSHFDNNNNILLTVITSMFSKAKNEMKTREGEKDAYNREELLKQFESVFKSLKSIKSELSTYDLESLNSKSDAEDLKEKMNILVDRYLNYLTDNSGEKSKLILLIDDIDMSVSFAPEMLEQLRKYLELNNLIILMSANLGQLYNEMREKYSSAFQYTLKDSNQALSIDVEDLATKYLLKVFPTSRRINVERHVDQLLKTNLIVEGWNDKNKRGSQTENEGIQDDKSQDEGDFQKVILSLIWSKTRLLFIPKDPKNTLHPIIPTNLRDLAQFLDMLTSLPNIRNIYIDEETKKEEPKLFAYKEDYEKCEHNLQDFKNYVMRTWIPNHLKVDEELVFRNIPTDITEINKHLINSINIIGTKHKDNLMSREVGLDIIERNADNVFIDRDIYTMVSPNDPKFVKANKISDIFNQPSNYSYGDLLLMIDKYETYFESEEHRKFTDAIKIYYSILLFETMFFESTNVRFKKDDYNELKEEDRVLPIQKLIGGTVYYPNYFEIIKDKYFNQKGPSFDAKRAFYHKLLVEPGEKVGENYPFFAVLYYGDIRPDRYDTKHIYDTTFENDATIDGTDFVTFDILSILSNMINPWHTYFRAGEGHVKEDDDNKRTWKNKIEGDSTSTDQSDREGWRGFCEIKRTNKTEVSVYIPNSILPFYSVDMMLNYLKESFDASKIIDDNEYAKDDYKGYDDFKVKGRECLFSLYESNKSDKLKEITEGLNQLRKTVIKAHIMNMIGHLESDTNNLMNLFNELEDSQQHVELKTTIDSYSSKVQNSKDLINNIKNEIDWLNQDISENAETIEDLKKKVVPEHSRSHYLNCIEILNKAIEIREQLLEVPQPDSLGAQFKDATHYYLNAAISILLEKYTNSQKERDNLIKELHKYSTPSEIFKHLVESLWDNKMTEICIRSDIQAKVRKEKSVGNYYIRLWEKTKGLLEIANDNAIPIYREIFNKAAKTFIIEGHIDVTGR